jgi:hypothetical protein
MDVVVVFKFPDITDPDSEAADSAIASLTLDLKNAGIDCEEWFIDDAIGDAQQGGTHG